MSYRPTNAELDLLELALRSESGNPWPLLSMSQRAGGAKDRMFEKMKKRGLFDRGNEITNLGRHVFLFWAAKQRIELFRGKRVRRMIFYPGPVNDDTCRCFSCGQIDESFYHQDHIHRAALNTSGFAEEPVVA